MKNVMKAAVLGAVLALSAGTVMAEKSGETSTNMNIKVTLPSLSSISKPTDIRLSVSDTEKDLNEISHFNINANTSGLLKLKITGGSHGEEITDFALSNENSDKEKLPFQLKYKAKGKETVVGNGVKLTPEAGVKSALIVSIKSDALKATSSGNYAETLTLTLMQE